MILSQHPSDLRKSMFIPNVSLTGKKEREKRKKGKGKERDGEGEGERENPDVLNRKERGEKRHETGWGILLLLLALG